MALSCRAACITPASPAPIAMSRTAWRSASKAMGSARNAICRRNSMSRSIIITSKAAPAPNASIATCPENLHGGGRPARSQHSASPGLIFRRRSARRTPARNAMPTEPPTGPRKTVAEWFPHGRQTTAPLRHRALRRPDRRRRCGASARCADRRSEPASDRQSERLGAARALPRPHPRRRSRRRSADPTRSFAPPRRARCRLPTAGVVQRPLPCSAIRSARSASKRRGCSPARTSVPMTPEQQTAFAGPPRTRRCRDGRCRPAGGASQSGSVGSCGAGNSPRRRGIPHGVAFDPDFVPAPRQSRGSRRARGNGRGRRKTAAKGNDDRARQRRLSGTPSVSPWCCRRDYAGAMDLTRPRQRACPGQRPLRLCLCRGAEFDRSSFRGAGAAGADTSEASGGPRCAPRSRLDLPRERGHCRGVGACAGACRVGSRRLADPQSVVGSGKAPSPLATHRRIEIPQISKEQLAV